MEQNNLNTKTNTQTTTTTNQNKANKRRKRRSRKKKSYGDVIKSRYSKACFIVAKIENNSRNGTPHENDQIDREKFQLVIDECLKYQESKAEEKKEMYEAPKDKKKETTKVIIDKLSLAPKKQQDEAPIVKKNKKSTKIITDELCMALANESNGKLKPVVAEWPMIENRMSNILYKYLLHNKNCPIPRYDSGEIYRGFFLIQCKDTFSKDFLSNCVTMVRDAFKGLTLTLIPAAQIPEGGFDDKTSNTLTTNNKTIIECQEEEFIEAPPPPTWQNDTDETNLNMEDKKVEISKTNLLDKEAKNRYQNYLQRYQYFANKGPLKGRDKKKLRRCESKIKNFEIRHGINTEIDDQMNSPQPNEGFQLSVNYFDQSRDSMAHNPFRRDFPQTSRSSYDPEFEDLSYQQPEKEESFPGRHISSKTKSNYKRALRFLRNLTEFTDLTYKQQKYKNKYVEMIKRYEEILGINNEMLDYQETQSSNDFRGQHTTMPTEFSNSGFNYHDWDEENYNKMERDRAEFPEFEQMSRANHMSNSSWNYGEPETAGYNEMRRDYTAIRQRTECNSTERTNFEPDIEPMSENFTSNRPRTAYPSTEQMPQRFSTARSNFEPDLEPMSENFTSTRHGATYPSTARSNYQPEQMPEHLHNLMPHKMPNSSWNYDVDFNEMRANHSTSNRPRAEEFSSAANNSLMPHKMPNSSWNYEAAGNEMRVNNSTSNRSRSEEFSSAATGNRFYESENEPRQTQTLMTNKMLNSSRNYEAAGNEMQVNNFTSNRPTSEFSSTASNMFENEPRQTQTLKPNIVPNNSWNCGHSRGNSGQRSICPQTVASQFNFDVEIPAFPQTSNQNLMRNSSLVDSDTAGRSSLNIDVKTKANTVEESTKTMLEKQIYEFLNNIGDEEDPKERANRQKPTEISYPSVKTPVTAELKRKSDSLRKSLTDRFEICRPNIEDKPTTLSRSCDPRKTSNSYTYKKLKRKTDSSKTPVMEVITLSDDSDNEQDKARQEYFKALGYLRKLQSLDPDTLSEQEKRFQETSRFMVRQFENKFGLMANKSKTPWPVQPTNEELTMASRENRSRWNLPTSSDKLQTTQKPGEQSRTWTFENTKSYPRTSSSSWQNSNEMYTNTPTGDIPFILPTQRNPESQRPRIDNETNADAEHWYPPLETIYPTITNNPDLQIAIIDRNENDFKIPNRSWTKIEQELLQALVHEVELTNNTKIAMFDGMHWKYGIKIVQCENMDSLNFIKRFIIKLSLKSTSEQYDVIPVKELPRRSIVKISIPPPNLEDNAIFKILKAQNHTLYTWDWTLINSREMSNKNGKNLYISISPTSLKRLRQIKGEIRYGINRLQVQLPQEDDETSGENLEPAT